MNIQISINKVSSSGSAETGGWVTLGLEGDEPDIICGGEI